MQPELPAREAGCPVPADGVSAAEAVAGPVLRKALDSLPVLVVYVDRQRRYRFANACCRSWYGLSPEDVCGRHVRDVVGAEAYAVIAPAIELALAGQHVCREHELCLRDGRRRWVQLNYAPDLTAQGEIAGYFAQITDITDRKRAEADRAVLAAIVSSADAAILSKTLDGIITSWNPGAERMYGYSAAEAVGSHVSLIIPADHGEELRGIFERIRAGKRIDTYETVRVTKDGRRIDVSLTISPVQDTAGALIGASAIARDITGEKRARERIRESENRFRTMADAAPVLVWIAGSDMRGTWFNRGWLEFTGRTLEQELGDGWTESIHPEDAERNLAQWRDSFAARRQVEVEYRLRRRDGVYRWMLDRGIPLITPDGAFAGYIGTCTDITDRREAEQATKESEIRFRALADNIAQLAWMADETGWIFWYNRRWFEYTGTTLEQMRGWGWQQVHHPDHVEQVTEKFRRHIEAGIVWEDTFPLRGKDGAYRWFLSRAFPIQDEQGRVFRWFGTNTDITEQRATEQALRESEERLKIALRAGRMGAWEWRIKTGAVLWSSEVEQIHGLPAGTFGGTMAAVRRDMHPDDVPRVEAAIQQCLERHTPYNVEYRIILPTGRVAWLEAHGELLLDSAGSPERMVGVCTDVTERKRSRERFQLAVEAAPSAVVMADAAGRITLASSRTRELFGYHPDELLGQPIEVLVPQRLRARHARYRTAFLEDAANWPGPAGRLFWGRRKDGATFRTEVAFSVLNMSDGPAVLTTIVDVSERERAQKALRESNRRLAEKNREIEEFVYTVSHDLKSPLVTILSFLGLLREDIAAGNVHAVQDALDRIQRSAERMDALIRNLLEFSRIGRVHEPVETLDVTEVLRRLESEFAGRLERAGATLTIQAPLPKVRAVPNRLVETFENLLTNAIKYGCPEPGGRIEVGGLRRRGETRLYVRDNGPGIAPEYHQKVFGLFLRLDSRQEGTGVGLAAVARMMRQVGGRAWVESAPGEGATFWLSFPSAATPKRRPTRDVRSHSPGAAKDR